MATPNFGELGRNARDVFNNGYHFGISKLEVKTKPISDVEFSVSGLSNLKSGKHFGTFETKYNLNKYGVVFTEKLNTNNVLITGLYGQDYIMKGMKFSLDTFLHLRGEGKSLKAKTEYKNKRTCINFDMDFIAGFPVINASSVLRYNGWLAGGSTTFDSQKLKIVGNSFALGYAAGDIVVHTSVDNRQDLSVAGSVYHKVNPNLETAVSLAWSASYKYTCVNIGCKYNLDSYKTIRAKVNNSCLVGLSYSQKFRECLTISLSTLIDGKNLSESNCKLGCNIEIEV